MMSDLPGQAGLDELQTMAAKIGLRPEWFQNKPRWPHYDVQPRLRAKAIAAGAQAVDDHEMIRRMRLT